MYEQILDHATRLFQSILLVLQQARFRALLEDVLGPAVQLVEDEAWNLLTMRTLAASEGAQLDVYGRLLGLERQGWDDDRYRAYLGAQLMIRYSRGDGDRLLDILAVLTQTAGSSYLFEVFPAQVQMEYDGPLYDTDPDWATGLVDRLERAAGPGILVGPVIERASDSFRFGVAGAGFGDGKFGRRVG